MKVLIKIGGALLDDAPSRQAVADQIAQAAKRDDIGLCVVHGGGKQMTRFLEERGIESRFVRGLRVTSAETIDAVLKVFAGSVNTQLTAALAVAGLRPVGLTGIDSGIASADQLDPELGFVGRVTSSDPALLNILCEAGYLPVIACVAGGKDGSVFNVNADSMAVAVAAAWSASRLIFLTDVPGVLDASKAIIPALTRADCTSLITSGVATGGMQAKLKAASDAVERGVQEVSIVRGSDPAVVQRVLAGERLGTSVGSGAT